MNEEKRYFQMKLMSLEKTLERPEEDDDEEETFVDCHKDIPSDQYTDNAASSTSNSFQSYPNFLPQINGPLNSFSIPPTIPECDDCDY